jgi:hypothetical protein
MSYFASLPTEQVGEELVKRVKHYYHLLELNNHLPKIRRAYRMYYGLGDANSSFIREGGEQGELLEIRINHLRSILNHILVLTTQNRPALKATAINSDYSSLADAKLGDSLLDYYFKTRNIEEILKDATELALITGKGYVTMRWNTQRGEEYGVHPDTGAVIYDGDVEAGAKSCLEVAHDIFEERPSWYIVRELRNKWDLAAQYPELADRIGALSNADDDASIHFNHYLVDDDDNIVPHYTFYHAKSPAMPQGRIVEFLDGDLVLMDGPLPYREPPVYSIAPGKIRGTQLGYSPGFDLLAINDALNELHSAILTNQSTFATNNIWVRPGSNVETAQLAGGLNLIESDEKPEVINLGETRGETFKYAEILQKQMETLSGINDVLRGNPQASLESGSALALVASQALAYNSGLQASFGDLLKYVGNAIIYLLQDYASTPKVATIVGIANRSMLKEFTGENLKGIDRVVVEEVSAVSRTTAGRMQLAENLLNSGLITRPEEYLTLVETGSIEPLLQSRTTETMLVRQENEALRDGDSIVAIMTDLHGDHIRGHKEVLADPEMRKDPELVMRVLNHIQEHMDLLRSADPALMAVLREQDIPAPAAPQGPIQGAPPEMSAPQMPNQPSLPEEAPPELQQAYEQAIPQ